MEIDAVLPRQFLTEIVDPSHAGEARRVAVELAESVGFNQTDRGKIAIAVTEMATNLVKHAQHGKLLYEPVRHNGSVGVRVLALDKGPGIRNVSEALQDGYSTYGSSGNGLGAVRRLSSVFDLYSMPSLGTCILTEFLAANQAPLHSILFPWSRVACHAGRVGVWRWMGATRRLRSLLLYAGGWPRPWHLCRGGRSRSGTGSGPFTLRLRHRHPS